MLIGAPCISLKELSLLQLFSLFLCLHAFAMITALLLKCSKRCELIRSRKEKTCLTSNNHRQCSLCNVLILLMLQAVFTCLPRAILVTMFTCFIVNAPKDNEKNKSPFHEIPT